MTETLQRPVKEALFFRPDRIGDFLLNLPAIHALKKTYPDIKITVVTHPIVEDLVRAHPDIDHLIPFSLSEKTSLSNWWKLYRQLKQRSFDVAVISCPHKVAHLLSFLLRIPVRLGYSRKWDFFLTHTIKDKKFENQKHEVEYNLDLVSPITSVAASDAGYHQYTLPLDPIDEKKVENVLQQKGITPHQKRMVINPYTTNERKQWPIKNIVKLLERGATLPHLVFLLIGGPEDTNRIDRHIMSHLKQTNVKNLSGQLSLRETGALLKHSDLLISNDSGPAHIATAFSTKMVILFGHNTPGSHPRRWGPIPSPGNRMIVKEHIQDILVGDVWQAINEQLK